MGSLRGRMRKLEEAAEAETVNLSCPTCGETFTLYGDPAVAFIVYQWEQGYEGETSLQPTDPAVLKLTEHPHDPSRFIDIATGRPWLDEFEPGTVCQ